PISRVGPIQNHFRSDEVLFKMRVMINIARLYYFVFAALTAAGGVMGFVKASSKPSLIAGVVSGLLLAAAGVWMPSNAKGGCILGIVVSVLLLGRFLPAFLKKGVFMPAVPMIILSIVGIVLAIVALVRS
ncbi:MAG: TMEM14 family protein, partial [Chthoniobacteraceae bacterium]|nr:TMEM14 family protein [Chthoniobacteraceae bacterium]